MRSLTDWELIAAMIVIVAAVTWVDDGAAQRWCDAYQFCEDQLTHMKSTDGTYTRLINYES